MLILFTSEPSSVVALLGFLPSLAFSKLLSGSTENILSVICSRKAGLVVEYDFMEQESLGYQDE